MLRLHGELMPIVQLSLALGGRTSRKSGNGFVVAAKHAQKQAAFVVDRVLGEQDVVVKPLSDLLGEHQGLAGATVLDDGRLGLIIDTASLVLAQSRAGSPFHGGNHARNA
jgi:two-component system chemotaxis sensor kinase CheA